MAEATTPSRITLEDIRKQYPLHLLVWNNDYEGLKKEFENEITKEELELKDVRGRSPLMLAVTLGHLESAKFLMQKGANVNTENRDGWTVVQEAVATGDPELVNLVLEMRDYQRYSSRVGGVPELLLKLKEAPDFYVEMKWEFTSWVPLVSRICPSDTYKVYKQGSRVRIDTTLLGFDHNNWQRGNTSFIFHGQTRSMPAVLRCNRSYIFDLKHPFKTSCQDEQATIMEVDHETRQVFVEQMQVIAPNELNVLHASQEAISQRLTTPIVTTYIDTDKISFERNKSGMWGWRQDKTEAVNGRTCKVFGASNVELVTKTRCEHLSEQDKQRYRGAKTPLQSFLGIAETEERVATPSGEEGGGGGITEETLLTQVGNPCRISTQDYFDASVALGNRDIGRPKDITTKIQKFRATLWLCEQYPLSLPEQIMPIVDLMAISSSHFAKLRNFIQMQLPAGFPVKIEIPLFHVLNARITFGNIFGMEEKVEGVRQVSSGGEGEVRTTCVVDDSCFQPPASYTIMGADMRRGLSMEEDDDMLQYAIQQSLMQAGGEEDQVDIWEALQVQRPNTPSLLGDDEEEKQLQRAIQASLSIYRRRRSGEDEVTDLDEGLVNPGQGVVDPDQGEEVVDPDLLAAIEASERQRLEDERQRRLEEETLEQVLRLSLEEK
ncbi:ankyrin repeat domain-containing protein 13D isoform X2 [Nilaparvata lugens]|uniref:ankyrin repeat domain-containing protein 13D isoform X2 n=1 Tax=Nilaparvata lugens TaxID=108931 RepID=UPI00193CAE4C|nr:ankyrin repeat domain-containing protein 13D isoform X2 [Nilaparvata lugens]